MSTVSNASPLIALAAIGQLPLLPGLFGSITIPPAVAAEIAPSIAARPGWLDVQPLAHGQPTQIERSGLGAGEREALSLGLECGGVDYSSAFNHLSTLSASTASSWGQNSTTKSSGLLARPRIRSSASSHTSLIRQADPATQVRAEDAVFFDQIGDGRLPLVGPPAGHGHHEQTNRRDIHDRGSLRDRV